MSDEADTQQTTETKSLFDLKNFSEKDINPFTRKPTRAAKKRVVHEWIAEITERNRQRKQKRRSKCNPFLKHQHSRHSGTEERLAEILTAIISPPSGLDQYLLKD